MCFSAGASFATAGILALLGSIALHRASNAYRFLAMIPVFFAIQQCAEGITWLILEGFNKADFGILGAPLAIIAAPLGVLAKALELARYYTFLQTITMYVFLFFALIIWPFWIPLSCLRLERQRLRRHILHILLFLGTLLSLFLLGNLLIYGATISVVQHHIVYINPIIYPEYSYLGTILYCVITAGSFIVSSIAGAPLLGIMIALSAGISWYLWYAAFVSVWCFFAAVLSVTIIALIPHHAPASAHKHE